MSIGRRRFRILSEIAEGAFGKVFLAEQLTSEGFSRVVALKVLHAQWSGDGEVAARTRDEARVLGRIRHDHIVQVEDLTSIDGKCAIVMEYLEGADLKAVWHLLRDGRRTFPRRALLQIGSAVASALDAAYHTTPLQGGEPLRVIHRDIKPSNVFVTLKGGVKVLDFGTARADFAEREARTLATAFGSAGYLAPERVLGNADTPGADVFSLGVTLWEMLTLESFGMVAPRPHRFPSRVEDKLAEVPLTGSPAWCSELRQTLGSMLAFEPERRPSAAELVERLESLAGRAPDADLRRFSREVVADAHSRPRISSTQDPLVGQTVEEDDPSVPAPDRYMMPLENRSGRAAPSASPARADLRDAVAYGGPAPAALDRGADGARFVAGVLFGALLLVSTLGVVVGLAVLVVYFGVRAS
jgi:serine/threonine protein kinase